MGRSTLIRNEAERPDVDAQDAWIRRRAEGRRSVDFDSDVSSRPALRRPTECLAAGGGELVAAQRFCIQQNAQLDGPGTNLLRRSAGHYLEVLRIFGPKQDGDGIRLGPSEILFK